MTESLYQDFAPALAMGQYNEKVLAHEFEYQGIPLISPPPGKQPFDRYLQDGRSLEMKLDVRSQCTGSGCIEFPTIARHADFYIHTFTYAKVYTWEEYNRLYLSGKVIKDGVGQYEYEGHYIRGMGQHGTPLYQFINSLKN